MRIVKSAYVDLKTRHNAQGASTLSMQLAGMLFLDRSDRTWRRKIPEVLITMHLEQKLTKEQIFEYYANQVPLGNRGSFGIRGFGEAAEVFFGKDVSRLTLPEAATLAGLIQQPSFINPYRWPDRAKQRRNLVLKMMRENEYISDADYRACGGCAAGTGAADNARGQRRSLLCRSGERRADREVLRIPIFKRVPTGSTPRWIRTCSEMPPKQCGSAWRRPTSGLSTGRREIPVIRIRNAL